MNKNDPLLTRLKDTELKILLEFDRICRKNHINYSLGYGSLLGAIRHKGFIPWDDDVDIMMTLKDYLKFEKIALSELKPDYYFQSRYLNPQNFVYWNRIGLKNTTSIDLSLKKIKADWGICIDLYPMIPISDDKKKRKKDLRLLKLLYVLSLKYYHKGTFKEASFREKLKKLVHILTPNFLSVLIVKNIYKHFTKKEYDNCHECIEFFEYAGNNKMIFPCSWFNEYIQIDFESKELLAIKEYDKWLTLRYGDYMRPPKNKTKHCDDPNVYIDFEKSYKDFWKQ